MKQIIFFDIRKAYRSVRFWIAAGAIILSAIINLSQVQWYDPSVKFGVFGLFIYGNIDYNPLMSYIAPFIPALASSRINVLPTENISERNDFKNHVLGHSISSMIVGGSVFLFSFLIIFLGCFVIDPSPVTTFEPFGLFKEVFYISMPVYILLFVVHSTIFGAIYALFGTGITLITKSNAMGLVMPGVIYHSIYYIGTFFSQTFLSWITILFPVIPFNFGGLDVPLWKNSLDLGLSLIASITISVIGYSKIKKGLISNSF